jgi:tetraacyldisaccharide-1-P 4'-kinase
VEDSGRAVVGTRSFVDHHRFTQTDILGIEGQAKTKGATTLVTTAKDAVKLKQFEFKLPCVVAIAGTVMNDCETFRTLVTFS